MTDTEYENIQRLITEKMNRYNQEHRYYTQKHKDGYEEACLKIKSLISNMKAREDRENE